MIDTGIFCDVGCLELWLEAFSKQNSLAGIGCDAAVFESADKTNMLAEGSVRCLHAVELLSGDACGMFELAGKANSMKKLMANVYGVMNAASSRCSCSSFSIPLRLDRMDAGQWEEKKQMLASALGCLLSAPMFRDFQIELPVQFPKAFPESLELERSLELCSMAKALPLEKWDESYGIVETPPLLVRSDIKLAVHVRPEEGLMPDCFDDAFLAGIGTLFFNYTVSAQETLFDDEQEEWAGRLKAAADCVNVIFKPLSCPAGRIGEICQDCAAWANYYQNLNP